MQLNVMDMRMNAYSFRMLYVFPPLTADVDCTHTRAYDLHQLERSFDELLYIDYPFFIDGEMCADPTADTIHIQAREYQDDQPEAQKVRGHTTDPSLATNRVLCIVPTASTQSTHDVLATLEYSLTPSRDPDALLAVKCTPLRDGGLVIGVNVHHCVFDAEACFAFMTQWGMHYRRVGKAQRPTICHDRSQLFARGRSVQFAHPEYTVISTQAKALAPAPVAPLPTRLATTMRAFRVRDSDLKALKSFVVQGLSHPNANGSSGFISTTDALTALLTLLITQARDHGNDANVGTAVNGRQRLQPPLPDHYAGNVVFTAFSRLAATELKLVNLSASNPDASIQQLQEQLACIALRIRQSIQRQDAAFMRDSIEFLDLHGPTRVSAATKFFFGSDVLFSSWIGLGSLDADFGSRPLRVSNSHVSVLDGVVVFQEISKLECDGDGYKESPGVDVVVYLEVEAMARLEKLWLTMKETWAVPA